MEFIMNIIKRIALALVIIGAINWGLIGLFRFDLVAAIFGGQTAGFSRVIYAFVGISGLICTSLYFSRLAENDVADKPSRIHSENLNYGTEFASDDNDELKRDR